MKSVSVDEVLAWRPGDHWTREKILEWTGGRTEFTALDALSSALPRLDAFWIADRAGGLSDEARRAFAADCIARVPAPATKYAEEIERIAGAKTLTHAMLEALTWAVQEASGDPEREARWQCNRYAQYLNGGPQGPPVRRREGKARGAVTVRPATNADGATIEALVRSNGFHVEGLDWSRVEPFWLLAEAGGAVVGVVNIAPSRPILRVEMLSLDLSLSPTLRRLAVARLLFAAILQAQKFGAQMVSGVVPFELKEYKRFLKKRGAVVICQGNLMAMRLS